MIAHSSYLPSRTARYYPPTRMRYIGLLRPPVRVYSGTDCSSCGKPIDRDGVCRCTS